MADYDAFISYSHAADGHLAPALKAGLEQLARPWARRRALRVFQDTSGLGTSPGLWSTIERALDSARVFILLASPRSAASPWVQQEISYFTERHPDRTVLVAITDGDWRWDASALDFDWQVSTALPIQLQKVFSEEPLITDLRWAGGDADLDLRNPRFRAAVRELAAPLHGIPPEDVDALDLHEFRRGRLMRRLATTGITVLALAASVAGLLAISNARDARAQQQNAEQSAAEATASAQVSDAQRLAAVGAGFVERQTDLAILLAMHSLEKAETSEGRAALARAMNRPAASSDPLSGSEGGAQGLDTANHGGLLAWGAQNGEVVLWDTANRREIRRLAGHDSSVRAVGLSPDGATVASVGVNGLLLVHRAADGRVVMRERADGSFAATFRPDGRVFATSADGAVVIWDPVSGASVARVAVAAPVRGVTFSPDGSIIAASDERGTITLADAESGTVLRTWSAGSAVVTSVAFDPEGRRLATADLDGSIAIWNAATGEQERTFRGHQAGVLAVGFSPDGDVLASSAVDATVRLWDVGSGKLVGDLRGHNWGVPRIAFAASRGALYSAAPDGVRQWDLRTGVPDLVFFGGPRVVTSVALTPAADRVVIGGPTGAVLWATDGAGQPSATLPYHRVELSDDGELLAGVTPGGQVRVHEVSTGAFVRNLERVHTGLIWDLEFSPGGQRLAATTDSGHVVTWDVATGSLLSDVAAHRGLAYAVAFHPDGSSMATTGEDGRLRIWDPDRMVIREERKLITSRKEASQTSPVAFSPDGERLAVGLTDGTLIFLDPVTGDEMRRIAAHQNRIYDIAFSPDGEIVATGGFNGGGTSADGYDGGLRLWDVATGQQVGERVFHDSQVESVAFSGDGRWLASGGADGTVALWPGPAGWTERACEIAGRELSADEQQRFLQPIDRAKVVCPA